MTTKSLFEPLNDNELDRLGRFLLDRVDEEADTEGKDEGVLNVSDLDGLLTAIVSGPVTVPPSRWLPAVWGDFEPVWESKEDFEEMLNLMMRHMNDIAVMLMEQPEEFEPIFLERVVEDRRYTIVDEWCQGYMRGVALEAEIWRTTDPEMTRLLAPILAFTGETDWLAHREYGDTEIEAIQSRIPVSVREIHAYWLARREEFAPEREPVRRSGPRVGRNDPCPCGSGKKYKKCCLH